MSNRLSFCIFFLLFLCDRIFSAARTHVGRPCSPRVHLLYILLCVYISHINSSESMCVCVCVCVIAGCAPVVSFQLFFPFSTLLSFYSAFTHRRRAPSHARTLVGTRLSPVCTYQLYTHTHLPYIYTPRVQ